MPVIDKPLIAQSARSLLISLTVCVSMGVPRVPASEPLELEGIKSRLKEQGQKIESLHLRIRRVTTLAVDPKEVRSWPNGLDLPKYVGTDEVLVAIKGNKRYRRVLELDYSPLPFGQSVVEGRENSRRYFDEARAWTGTALLEREAGPDSGREEGKSYRARFEYRSTDAEKAHDAFPPSPYLSNVGLAATDPTAKDEARRNLQKMGHLPELLGRWPYEVVRQTEAIEGATCLVLEGTMQCLLPVNKGSQSQRISDKLWLDLEHGLAARKRETQIGDYRTRVVNRDFVEVVPGVWLPKESHMECRASSDAPKPYRDKPLLSRRMQLLFWVVNEVPDDLFEVALTAPRSNRFSAFKLAPAFHWIHQRTAAESSIEGWAVKGIGRRIEYRDKSKKLEMLVVDTPRWRFTWRPNRNRVTAQPSRLEHAGEDAGVSQSVREERADIVREYETLTGMFSYRKVRLGEDEVDRLFGHFPPDPLYMHMANLHHFDPKVIRTSPIPTEFYTRRHWYDPKTGLTRGYRCGCKGATPTTNANAPALKIDYPQPENIPRELFNFQIPATARLTVVDPELDRPLQSDGQPEEPANIE
jgi:hypothetical protein